MPKYIPLPIPGGSISGALKAKDELSRLPENMATKNYKASRTGQWFQEKLDTASYAETQKLREAITSAPDKIKDSVKMSQNGFRDE